MTDPTPTSPDQDVPATVPDDQGAGVKRPDEGGTQQPGQTRTPPAPGGDGAAGAGGPDGFGTGT